MCALVVLAPAMVGETADDSTLAPHSAPGAAVCGERDSQGASMKMDTPVSSLSEKQLAYLDTFGWTERVQNAVAMWVSVDEQVFRIVRGGEILFETPCATAANGTGSEWNSLKTPLGWHHVVQKLGAGAPWGQVFRSRQATNEIWRPGDSVTEDLVLTRVLVLTGDEPGKNKGGNVDSLMRGIYVHGTNAEERIGTPSSHGCVRLRNDDVIRAYEMVPDEAPLLITERTTKRSAEGAPKPAKAKRRASK